MLTTGAGLCVAIPYFLLYNHLPLRVQTLTRLTETRTEELLDTLTETKAHEAGQAHEAIPGAEQAPTRELTRHAV